MNCPKCNATNLRTARKCSSCGAPLAASDPRGVSAAQPPQVPATHFRVRRSNTGGMVQAEYNVGRPRIVIGRSEGDWTCPDDAKMSRRHAELALEGSRLFLQDLDSTNGTYLRVPSRFKLSVGDCVLLGNELFRVDSAGQPPDAGDRTLVFGEVKAEHDLTLLDPRGSIVQEIVLKKNRTIVGRGRADLSFPQDTALAEQHAAFVRKQQGLYLEDLGSARGSFRRIRERVEIREGDRFLLGEQVFHILASG